jgi:V/A-type H+-transporting ATPase subunit D
VNNPARRRVNALEYILIPATEDGVRSIQGKLNEMKWSNASRLMLIKRMLEAWG